MRGDTNLFSVSREVILKVLWTALILLLGMVFPIYEYRFPIVDGLNIVWGTIFGLGLWVALYFDFPSFLEVIFGLLTWPTLIIIGLFRINNNMIKSNTRIVIWTALIISTCLSTVNRPNFADGSFDSSLPTFQKFIRSY